MRLLEGWIIRLLDFWKQVPWAQSKGWVLEMKYLN